MSKRIFPTNFAVISDPLSFASAALVRSSALDRMSTAMVPLGLDKMKIAMESSGLDKIRIAMESSQLAKIASGIEDLQSKILGQSVLNLGPMVSDIKPLSKELILQAIDGMHSDNRISEKNSFVYKSDEDFSLYLSKMPALNRHEAACLLLGRDPLCRYTDTSYVLVYNFLERAQQCGELEVWIKPLDLLNFSERKDMTFPSKAAICIRRSIDDNAVSSKEKEEGKDRSRLKITKKAKSLHKSKREAYEDLLQMLDSMIQEIKNPPIPTANQLTFNPKYSERFTNEEVAYLSQLQEKKILLISSGRFKTQEEIIFGIEDRCPSCENLSKRAIEEKFAAANKLFETLAK